MAASEGWGRRVSIRGFVTMKPSTVMTLIGAGLVALGGTLGAVEAAGALDLSGPQSDPDPQGAPMPASTPSDLWAGPLAQHQLAPLVRKGLDHHPALVAAAAARPGSGRHPGMPVLRRSLRNLASTRSSPSDCGYTRRARLGPRPVPCRGCSGALSGPGTRRPVRPHGPRGREAQVDAALAPVLA